MYLHWNVEQHSWQSQESWPVTDRAIHYGDGLFETLRFDEQGEIPLWKFHFARLSEGLDALRFPASTQNLVLEALRALPKEQRFSAGKLLISRGVGQRGYALPEPTTVQLLWHSFNAPDWAVKRFPQGFKAEFSTVSLARQPLLQGIKHLNRLEQVLARQQFPEHCQEMVLCDSAGFVIEGCMSNLFILKKNQLYTPDLKHSGVDGVIRRWLMQNYPVTVQPMHAQDLLESQALFFCNSLNGIIPVAQLAERTFYAHYSGWQEVLRIQHELEKLFCLKG